jgi:hypothetical protein
MPLETTIDNALLHEIYEAEFSKSELPPQFYFKRNNTDDFQYRAFGFSTSRFGDDLSQWRSYTQKGAGVCIEFDRVELENQIFKLLRNQMPVSHDCVYSKDEERALLKEYVQSVRDHEWYQAMNQFHSDHMTPIHAGSEFIKALQETAIQIKHQSFEAESEIRFFVLPDNFNGDIEIKPTLQD